MLEDYETNRQAADRLRAVRSLLDRHGEILTLLSERRPDEERSRT
jgi:hypothetical protein